MHLHRGDLAGQAKQLVFLGQVQGMGVAGTQAPKMQVTAGMKGNDLNLF